MEIADVYDVIHGRNTMFRQMERKKEPNNI